MMILSALIGSSCAIAGLYLSYYLHAASGATIVLLVTIAFFTAMLSKQLWRPAP
jgi:ABC-type Mn2+/Zn2+ transport system permease subunit